MHIGSRSLCLPRIAIDRSWQYVLEGRSVQQVTALLLAQGLLH